MTMQNTDSQQLFREALSMTVKRLGLPITDEELSRFSYFETPQSVEQPIESSDDLNDNEDLSLQLLKESSITVGSYAPTENMSQSRLVAIIQDNKPIIAFGYHDDEESIEIADKLLNDKDFVRIIEYIYGSKDNLHRGVVLGKEVFNDLNYDKYSSIVSSKQGEYEDGTGKGALEAIIFGKEHTLAFAMCVTNSVMMIMKPKSRPLSMKLSLR